ncbi:MAG: protein-(glutamine-N5) methyltransferase, release factor-specific [Alphaproteobacteria bacterium 65-7]|nr:MAG: protein-(glutamine-N5) methyltransferase, release factor-specific [Alphaproteobacteria bacterium 65-7]
MTLEEATRALAAAGIESPRAEARLLLAAAMGVSRDATLTAAPTPEQAARFAGFVARRAAREPFAYITGRKEFWSLELEVGPGVLVPRPDTETLIEQALKRMPDPAAPLRIADLGAGSGAILLAALAAFPRATGIGFESAPAAHAWATRNAARHAPGRAEIRLAGWDTAEERFDLVFSNPPYIPSGDIADLAPEVAAHEPRAALDGGPDGLDAYRALGKLLPRLLVPGGHALLEIGMGQAGAVEPLFPGLELVEIAPDLGGVPRGLIVRQP